MRVAFIVALTIAPAASAETLICSTWRDMRTCTSPGGYVSHESRERLHLRG